ncbi:MAG: UDP-N-acetylmuramoyl-L-alanyl-D-glutamate--2,6-diaminopimelate ligase [Desulfomonilaceae bacterium]
MSLLVADILPSLHSPEVWGNLQTAVAGVSHDSRCILPNFAFVAIVGDKADGHDFVSRAVEKGASLIVAQKEPPENFDRKIAWIKVADSRKALGPLAASVYGNPSDSVVLIGITGTNGKTTTTFLLESILKQANFVPGVIGTISHRWPGVEITASNTTPEASDIQKMLFDMRQAGVTHVIMEVSSHGLAMRRLDGCNFDAAIFSNLTHDHLDFHTNMEDYYSAKKLLFDELLPESSKQNPFAVINMDDPYGRRLANEISSVTKIKYGSADGVDIYAVRADISRRGISAIIRTSSDFFHIESDLVGAFNLSNILAALSVSVQLGIPKKAIEQGVKSVNSVPGRLERVNTKIGSIFVDYAHTPNALKNVLGAMREICEGKLITVMGCGGDRDKTKRPIMGSEAAIGSDFVVVTSDNPRTEDALDIIKQIERGVLDSGLIEVTKDSIEPIKAKGYVVIPDRREAIRWAISKLGARDILLLAGKGHETYQEINGVRHAFDDRTTAFEEAEKLAFEVQKENPPSGVAQI